MSKELLHKIITDFYPDNFIQFFREKNRSFAPKNEELSHYNDDNFQQGRKLGEIQLNQDEKIFIYTFNVTQPLSERSGKKAQYEKGKKILKETFADSGIFIFYDENGNFRFSLIYPEYAGTKRQWSYFKRFTYFVSPQLTNKTFLEQIGEGDFSTFQNIKEAFSVEPVTKQFYNELQYWYFWAMDKVQFPDDYKYSDDPEKDKEIRNATNLIRLITRIIFIWFLKEKGLIPRVLFSREKLRCIVKDFLSSKTGSSGYFNAILQNLFFGTLNQKMNERKFAEDNGYPANKKEYGIKNLYRYADKFNISKEEVLDIFKDIPFLNGGLFDCLDKEDESGKVIYIDGFSRNSAKQAIIPDYLFFQQEEEIIDLSQYELGTNKPVRGLIEILNSYNFTIDENTPIDQEIALDPELLGKVFENLLASYNPETATPARKATGSYYTPREIVDYMVTESLVEYFSSFFDTKQESYIKEIKKLVSYSDEEIKFSDEEKNRLILAIDNIKILDPACGSGAFPMGILHRLVHILQKLDPENKYWFDLQYQKALKETEEAFKLGDKKERDERLKEINETFDEKINFPDYARKLYLIENCIYGVDIQPIAIQISKLRFFISLVLDQKVDATKENLGIRSLPNLETKFVAANTLIGLDRPQQLVIRNPNIDEKEKLLKELRHKYFTANTRKEKLDLQKKDKDLRKELADLLIKDGWKDIVAKQIASFDPYDQNSSADWFDPEWMFGMTDGFDIVIANPPYIQLQKNRGTLGNLYKNKGYVTFDRTGDIYVLFYEKGLEVLRKGGVLCYITSNKWMRAGYGEKLRQYFLKFNPLLLVDLGPGVFESATVDTNILIIQKTEYNNQLCAVTYNNKNTTIDETVTSQAVKLEKLTKDAWYIGSSAEQCLKEKIEQIGKPLKDWDVKIYRGVLTGLNEAFIIDSQKREEILSNCKTKEERNRTEAIIKPILRGRDIRRYSYEWAGLWVIVIPAGWTNENKGNEQAEKFIENTFSALMKHLKQFEEKAKKRDDQGDYWWELRHCAYYPEFEKEKVVYSEIVRQPQFYFDRENFYVEATSFLMTGKNVKYICGLLNSKPVTFFFKQWYAGGGLGEEGYRYKKAFLENLPLPPITATNQGIVSQIEGLVDKILSAKKQNPGTDTSPWEREIDQLVYKLYGLTEEEVGIVEG